MEITLRKQLEDYFNNGIYPYVRKSMSSEINSILLDATNYDNIPSDMPDKTKTEYLNNILSRLEKVKIVNDNFSLIFNGGKR